MSTPQIDVPSPDQIRTKLFPKGSVSPVVFAEKWQAHVLLTPFGGASSNAISPPDQLTVADIEYDASNKEARLMRVRMYLLESLDYADFLFCTSSKGTEWWLLISQSADPQAIPSKAYGPFKTEAMVPEIDFLASNGFTHVGSWKLNGQECDAFSAYRGTHLDKDNNEVPNAGTWLWTDRAQQPVRWMNVSSGNHFKSAILGAFYLIDFASFSNKADSKLGSIYKKIIDTAEPRASLSPMLTYPDLLLAIHNRLEDRTAHCTLADIQALIPGVSFPADPVHPPSWTNKMRSECIMTAQNLFPIYCQVWYDWDFGQQKTVFVFNDGSGNYTVRQDLVLPRGKVGPEIDYIWDGNAWALQCCKPDGGVVPMPVPSFVAADKGRCRAVIRGNSFFGDMSIWSVMLGSKEDGWADFWYWFKTDQTGIIFSLAPAAELTLIDYQTFVQNPDIPIDTFNNPCGELPVCGEVASLTSARSMFFT